MLDQGLVDRIHNGVCAIGYLPVPLKVWRKDPSSRPLKVIGTGFLVRQTTVITNRHVIKDLVKATEAEDIPDSQHFISFIAPVESSHVLGTVRMVRRRVGVHGANTDVGFIEFKREPAGHFTNIHPLRVTTSPRIAITEEVYVCGYAHGNELTEKDGQVYRWGPVIQQGYVSGLSPFSKSDSPDEVLLDVRTARGMSGSPVFRPNDGEVVGIHNSAIAVAGITTTSFAIPLVTNVLEEWLRRFDESPETDELDSTSNGAPDA